MYSSSDAPESTIGRGGAIRPYNFPMVPASFLFIVAVLAAVGSGVVAGLLFGFSTAVMKSLARLPAEHGMRAMQHINLVILNPLFLGAFMGTALLSAVLALGALLTRPPPGSGRSTWTGGSAGTI